MTMSISSVLVDCLKSLNTLTTQAELADHATEVPTNLWADELGRLRVWAANIGAHQTGQSSLDYRLRDASHIKTQTIKLLERLRRTLDDVDEFLGEGAEEDQALSVDDGEETELQQIYKSVVDTIDCLFKLSMIIRRPAQHDKFLGTKKLDATVFEPFDRQHVSNKHPKAGSIVVDRLGAAISRRRAALKYQERHHAKLAKGIERAAAAGDLNEQRDAVSTLMSQTIATEFEEPHIDYDETASNSGLSQTSYAPSLWDSSEKITVPHIPKGAAFGKAFECPYCFFIITVSNRRSWTRHVFKDLKPYICVFSVCSAPNRLYESRHDWFQHLRTKHTPSADSSETNSCPLRCGADVPVLLLERHLGRHLEELALFALPRAELGDQEASNESQTSLAPAKDTGDTSSTSSDELVVPPVVSSTEQTKAFNNVSPIECTVIADRIDRRGFMYIEALLSKGVLHKGDRIILCGHNAPIVASITSMYTQAPRIGGQNVLVLHEKFMAAPQHVSITTDSLANVVVGSRLLVVRDDEDEQLLMETAMADFRPQQHRRWVDEANSYLNKTGRGRGLNNYLMPLKQLIAEGEELGVNAPQLELLRNKVSQMNRWREQVNRVLAGQNITAADDLDDLLGEGRGFMVAMPELTGLQQLYDRVRGPVGGSSSAAEATEEHINTAEATPVERMSSGDGVAQQKTQDVDKDDETAITDSDVDEDDEGAIADSDATRSTKVVLLRAPRDDELSIMEHFAKHAAECDYCRDPYDAWRREKRLCSRGLVYARDVANHLYAKDGKPFSVIDRRNGDRVQVQVPFGCEAVSLLVKAFDGGMKIPSHRETIENTEQSETEQRPRYRRYMDGDSQVFETIPHSPSSVALQHQSELSTAREYLSPLVENEEVALTKELAPSLSSHQPRSENQAIPNRGSIDQHPIMLDSNEALSPPMSWKMTFSADGQSTAYVPSGQLATETESHGYDADMEDVPPTEKGFPHEKTVREYSGGRRDVNDEYERRSRPRSASPYDSVFRRKSNYSSDDSTLFARRETHEERTRPDRKRDLSAGVLAGDTRESTIRYADYDKSRGKEAERFRMSPPPQPSQSGYTSEPGSTSREVDEMTMQPAPRRRQPEYTAVPQLKPQKAEIYHSQVPRITDDGQPEIVDQAGSQSEAASTIWDDVDRITKTRSGAAYARLTYRPKEVECDPCRRLNIHCEVNFDDAYGLCKNCIRLKLDCTWGIFKDMLGKSMESSQEAREQALLDQSSAINQDNTRATPETVKQQCTRENTLHLACGGLTAGGCRKHFNAATEMFYHCCLCDDDDYDHCLECGSRCPKYPVHPRMVLVDQREGWSKLEEEEAKKIREEVGNQIEQPRRMSIYSPWRTTAAGAKGDPVGEADLTVASKITSKASGQESSSLRGKHDSLSSLEDDFDPEWRD